MMPAPNALKKAEQLLDSMRIAEALRLFELAERANCDPDSCAAGRWLCHMLQGNYEHAWLESDSISARGNPDPYRFWDGRPVNGRRVLIRCIHGLGDTIQFIRYAPVLRAKARALTIEAQPALKTLLTRSRLADNVITWGDPEPEWDQQIEVIELPRVFRSTSASIPNRVPYIHVTSAPPGSENGRTHQPRIAIAWASGPYNPERSMTLAEMSTLFGIPNISFVSVQAGPHREQLAPWSAKVADLYPPSGSVLVTAEALADVDLVITVDTMVAHLAGAMARPVWTLLPFRCDWRWMLDRADSPWYPTMRLFRQPRPGDWGPVIQRVHHALLREFAPAR